MREKDIHLQDQAAHIAGHAVLMRGGVRSFQRVPGLSGVEVVRFLDHCDLSKPKLFRFSSTIFDADRQRVHQTFKKLYPKKRPPEGIFERFSDFTASKKSPYRLLRNTLAKADGGYFLQTEDIAAHQNPSERDIQGHTVELNPLQTRQEVIASFAVLKGKQITQGFKFSQSELRKFIDMHELQHARSQQIWAMDPRFYNPYYVPAIVLENPAYEKLWKKASTIRPKGDIEYLRYLNEQTSDTMAALMHLKAGGDVDLIKAISDGRAAGLLNGGGSEYGSFSVLDKIIEDSDNVRAKLIGASHEEIENFAVKLAGEFSLDRNGYYTQKLAAQELKAMAALRNGKQATADYHMGDAIKTARKLGFNTFDKATLQTHRQYLEKRHALAMQNLTDGPQLSHEEHKIEVLAAVKHAQDMHPEFNTPEGGQYLLKTRLRMAAKSQNLQPLPTELQIHDELTAYYGRQQAEIEKLGRPTQRSQQYEHLSFAE